MPGRDDRQLGQRKETIDDDEGGDDQQLGHGRDGRRDRLPDHSSIDDWPSVSGTPTSVKERRRVDLGATGTIRQFRM